MARLRLIAIARGVVVASLLAVGCSSTGTAAAPTDTAPAGSAPAVDTAPSSDPAPTVDLGPELDAAFAEWANAADGGGVALVRDVDGQVTLLAAGDDPQTEAPLNVEDRVRVGSISKIVTTVLVMQLVDEGKVALDDPISTYVDGLAIANDVTVRELLGHRSGIPNYTDSQGFFQVVVVNPDRKPTPTDLIAFTNGKSDFEPGSQFVYSNTNFIIAGMLIEAVTGETLAEALENRITGPLDLAATAFDDGTFTDVAGGYSAAMPSGNSFDQPYTSIAYGSWAAGGLVTTVLDLSAFLDAVFRGDLLSGDSRAAMMAGLDSGAEYGLGLASGSNFGVGHGGAIIGFNSLAEIDPQTGETIIVVVNNDTRNPDVPAGRLADILSEG